MRKIVQYEVTNVYEYSVSIYVSPILLYNAIFAMHDNPAQLQSMSNTRDSCLPHLHSGYVLSIPILQLHSNVLTHSNLNLAPLNSLFCSPASTSGIAVAVASALFWKVNGQTLIWLAEETHDVFLASASDFEAAASDFETASGVNAG